MMKKPTSLYRNSENLAGQSPRGMKEPVMLSAEPTLLGSNSPRYSRRAEPAWSSLYKEHYDKKVAPALMKQLHIKNVMACPKVNKVSLNIGLGKVSKEAAAFETAENTLKRITGQKPVVTKARKAISNFKIRAGLPIGLTVVLRGRRAEEFLWKLIHIALPRVRDFHGLSPKSVDRTGNMAIGFKEHLVFPEIKSDEVERLHGLEVIIKTSARTQERGLALFKALGFPFQKQ